MIRVLSLALLSLIIASCGVQRPLMKPKDIPAYQEEQRKKRAQIEQEQREDAEKAAAERAAMGITEPAK